jgi:ABC-type uncharacterized transport system involved in gliding motility auxiliary subunit
MTKKQLLITTVLTAAALILGLLISRRIWFRVDLTKTQAYTLSKVSRSLHTEIPDQIHLTYYLSDKLKAMYPQPGEIIDLLREYGANSRGKIRVSVQDPVKAGAVNALQRLGIRPTQLRISEEDQDTQALVYSGITIEYVNKVEVLPMVFSLETLEYDLTSRIRSLVRETKREIGVIVGDQAKQWNTDYEYLNLVFAQSGIEVRLIRPGDDIPEGLPGLVVLGGAEDLDEWDLYLIDRYIQTGGNALFAVHSMDVNFQTNETRPLLDKGLLSMLSLYGAAVKPALVLDKAALTLSYQTPTEFGIPITQRVRYPHWVGVLERNGNKDNPLTGNFRGLDLFWPNPLELNPPETVNAQPLFTSTSEAWLMTQNFAIEPRSPAYLFEQEAPDTKGVKILGAALTGRFPSYFAGLPKPVREGAAGTLPDLPSETRDSRIIVIGNTEMADNRSYNYTSRLLDLHFLAAAADWLCTDDDIIRIRTRQSLGQLNAIVDPKKRGYAETAAQVINVISVPLALIILGIARSWKRRQKAAHTPQ